MAQVGIRAILNGRLSSASVWMEIGKAMSEFDKLTLLAQQLNKDAGHISDIFQAKMEPTPPTLKIVPVAADVPEPKYQTSDASGLDLHAYLVDEVTGARLESVAVSFGATTKIRTGIRVGIPDGYEGQVRGRSGRAFYNGVFAYNGTIDGDFLGEVMVLLTCVRQGEVFHVKHGDRIAQLVIAPVARCRIEFVESLDETARGGKGFGSTGG